jgi:hypothetical protein
MAVSGAPAPMSPHSGSPAHALALLQRAVLVFAAAAPHWRWPVTSSARASSESLVPAS